MRWVHRFIRGMGRELAVAPRPLAYNFHGRLLPSLGPLLAFGKLTIPDFFFVQVGANDGRRADPIHPYVEQFELRGLLIEPQPELFARLCETYAHRTDLILVQAAIGPSDGEIVLHRVRPENGNINCWLTGIASVDADVFRSNARQTSQQVVLEELPVRSMHPASLIAEYQIPRIDLLQIDTEGYDYEVIKLFDIPRTRPSLIHFEHKHLRRREWEECLDLLLAEGYQVAHNFEDTLACHPTFLALE